MTERTDYRYTPEQTLKLLWTRIGTAAKAEGVSIEELAKRSDREFMRLPNVGKLCLAALRERYPAPDAAAGAVSEVNRLLGEMAAKRSPKPRVIQIAVTPTNDLVVLRDDGTVWEKKRHGGGDWLKLWLPGEGE